VTIETQPWRPGSFTKNFSWGRGQAGLRELHEVIRLGFNETLEDVPRSLFRERIQATNRPDYIPINFFLFNRKFGSEDFICVDELVFQALNFSHGANFDHLALIAFLLSHAGIWSGAQPSQRYPAPWANLYVQNRVANANWDASLVSANDIERFVNNDPRYEAKTSRKLATNLNYLFQQGHLSDFSDTRLTRWWVDSAFLALDRVIEDKRIDRDDLSAYTHAELLEDSSFLSVSGPVTLEKELALKHLFRLYNACGGRNRFFDEKVHKKIAQLPDDLPRELPNSPEPKGAVHPSNPRILKAVPASCITLARYAGFEVLSHEDLQEFDSHIFIRGNTRAALAILSGKGIKPTTSSEELMRITREK